jgi:hypothetical protein
LKLVVLAKLDPTASFRGLSRPRPDGWFFLEYVFVCLCHGGTSRP